MNAALIPAIMFLAFGGYLLVIAAQRSWEDWRASREFDPTSDLRNPRPRRSRYANRR